MAQEVRTVGEECWNRRHTRVKSVAFKTVGCRLNQAETALISAQFVNAGFSIVPFGERADVCIIHSCTITNIAERKSARLARTAKKKNPDAFIILAGCAVEANDGLLEDTGVDFVADQTEKYKLLEALPASLRPDDTVSAPTPLFATKTRALVKVQDGCNFRCTYCIVPDVRGEPSSRPIEDICDDARRLAELGHKEIVLTGANLGCYSQGSSDVIDLLRAVEDIPEVGRIRISSIEPSTVERRVIDFMSTSKKLCRFIHLPLQSGDDGILSRMHRRYTAAEYRDTVAYALDKIPRLGLGSDVITGFPGEDDAAFKNTFDMIESLPFSNLHIFPYSKRPGTEAALMSDQVQSSVAKNRSAQLLEIATRKKSEFAERIVGHPVDVLIEKELEDGMGLGWTGEYAQAIVEGAPNTVITFTPSAAKNGILHR